MHFINQEVIFLDRKYGEPIDIFFFNLTRGTSILNLQAPFLRTEPLYRVSGIYVHRVVDKTSHISMQYRRQYRWAKK